METLNSSQGVLQMAAATKAVGELSSGVSSFAAARSNARLAEREAGTARTVAGLEAGRIGREARRMVGAQTVAAAASGVDPTRGSPMAVMLDTISGALGDETLARWKGEQKAAALREEARLQRAAGRRALIGGVMGAGKAVTDYAADREKTKIPQGVRDDSLAFSIGRRG